VEALKAAHGQHQAAFDKHARDYDALKAAHARHANIAERVDYVEKLLGDSADKHTAEIEALKVAHSKHEAAFGKHAKDFDALRTASAHHASLSERVVYMEKLLGDSADKHAAEVEAEDCACSSRKGVVQHESGPCTPRQRWGQARLC